MSHIRGPESEGPSEERCVPLIAMYHTLIAVVRLRMSTKVAGGGGGVKLAQWEHCSGQFTRHVVGEIIEAPTQEEGR